MIKLDIADTFKINSSHLQACDTLMWSGIEAKQPNHTIQIVGSSIDDAILAVWVSNGAVVKAQTTNFANNFQNIYISDYNPVPVLPPPGQQATPPAPYAGEIYRCDFRGINSLPYYPFKGIPTYYGIKAENVYKLKIGNEQDIAYRNNFKMMRNGVVSYFSDVNIVNCNFDSIISFPDIQSQKVSDMHNYSAIAAYSPWPVSTGGSPISYINPLLEAGGSGNAANYFSNCQVAIGSRNFGVKLKNNHINAEYCGIIAYELRSDSEIKYNTIDVQYYNTGYTGIGIYAGNLLPRFVKLDIVQNTITNPPKTGIWVEHCSSSSVPNTEAVTLISNNTIEFNTNQSGYERYGIRLNKSERLVVASNAVINATQIIDSIVGISLGDCLDARVYSNYPLTYLVKGIRNVGTNLGTQMYCNQFYENKHGIYFEHDTATATIISNQGDSTRPSDNLWTNNVDLRMGGILISIPYILLENGFLEEMVKLICNPLIHNYL